MNVEEKITTLLKREKLDGILVSCPCNMRYLSGFRGGTGYLFITGGSRFLLTDSRYTTQAEGESPDYQVVTVTAEKNYFQWLTELAEREETAQVGFEDTVMIYETVERLKKEVPKVEFRALGQALNNLRQIKTENELACIRQAEAIGDKAFSYILDVIRPGMSEVEIALELEGFMRKHGAEGLSFDTIVASGENSAMPHAIPGRKKVEKGEFVTMDFGCVYEGYCSDMTRTIVLGKATDEQKEIYGIVLEAQCRALEGIRAGVTGKWVDALAREYITEKGYGDYFGHGLGHSVGLYIHEEPRLSPREDQVLRRGMVETVEPGIYLPGIGGVRIEDLVEITDDGCLNYTNSTKKLIEL